MTNYDLNKKDEIILTGLVKKNVWIMIINWEMRWVVICIVQWYLLWEEISFET